MRRLATITLVLATAACAERSTPSVRAVVRDSAGIQIVDNRVPRWTEGGGWTIDSVPLLDIGSETDSGEQFSQIQDLLRLPSGELIVAEGDAAQLRVFSDSGHYLRAIGRKGEGPGEFVGLGLVRNYRGDSLLAYDYQLRRISIFDQAGRFARAVNLRPPGGSYPTIEGALADGSFLALGIEFPSGAIQSGTVRNPMQVFRFGPEGELLDTLGVFPGYETGVYNETSGSNHMRISFTIPFGHETSAAVRPTEVMVGSNDSYEIRSFGPDGELRRILRRQVTPVPVTPQMIQAMNADEDAQNPRADAASRERTAKVRAVIVYPKTLPAFKRFLVDEDGNLWVLAFNSPGDSASRYTVFDSSGQMLGDVVAPEDFELSRIGENYLLGIWKDENEVQHVRMYALKK